MSALLVAGFAVAGSGARAEPGSSRAPGALDHEVLVDQLEFRGQNGDDVLHGELSAWLGGERHRLWLDASGETRTQGGVGGCAELQLSYGRGLADELVLRAGVRHDRVFGEGPDRHRSFLALDVTGVAPYAVEWTAAFFLSDDGDLSARLTALRDLAATPRWILQPRFEVNVAAHDARRFGIERGVNDVELGLRLRYEASPGAAPYLGVSWIRSLGNTADFARDEGGDRGTLSGVGGVRFAF